jgi:hypothetical protein
LAKFDSTGTQLWARQLGTSSDDVGFGVNSDSSGNVYVSGYTFGSMGGTNAGNQDAFIAKFDSSGAQLWVRQFGTVASDQASEVVADSSGNIYVTGGTHGSLDGASTVGGDAFLAKFNSNGDSLWLNQFHGIQSEGGSAVTVDEFDNVYVGGNIFNNPQGGTITHADSFVTKLNGAGAAQWTQLISKTDFNFAWSVIADGGSVYAAGSFSDQYNGGGDTYVIKISGVPEPTTSSLFCLAVITFVLAYSRVRAIFRRKVLSLSQCR